MSLRKIIPVVKQKKCSLHIDIIWYISECCRESPRVIALSQHWSMYWFVTPGSIQISARNEQTLPLILIEYLTLIGRDLIFIDIDSEFHWMTIRWILFWKVTFIIFPKDFKFLNDSYKRFLKWKRTETSSPQYILRTPHPRKEIWSTCWKILTISSTNRSSTLIRIWWIF